MRTGVSLNGSSLIGKTMLGYRMLRVVGEGATATVYEATGPDQRRVAIKILRAGRHQDPELLQRFFGEAEALRQIHHPGLVRVLGSGYTPDDGSPYILSEFLAGDSLATRLSRVRTLKLAECLSLGRQLSSALAAVHAKDFVHRDLKPHNIILVDDPAAPQQFKAKIVDFGIARRVGETTSRKGPGATILGTPEYMAPEQCRDSDQVSQRADVYSLGVLLYQCLAGRLPFQGQTQDLLRMQMEKAPLPLSQVCPDSPPGLSDFIDTMLSKDPAQRPSMREVCTTLEELEASHPGALQRASAGQSLLPPGSWPREDAPLGAWLLRSLPATAPVLLSAALCLGVTIQQAVRSASAGGWLFGLQTLVILLALIAVTSVRRLPHERSAPNATRTVRTLYRFLPLMWLGWLLLYLALTVQELLKGQIRLPQTSLPFHFFNNLSAVFTLLCAGLLAAPAPRDDGADPATDEEDEGSPVSFLLALLLVTTALELVLGLTLKDPADIDKLFGLLSGLACGLSIIRLASRLEHRALGVPTWLIVLLVFYALVQPVGDLAISDDRKLFASKVIHEWLRVVVISLALLGKVALFLLFQWLRATPRLLWLLAESPPIQEANHDVSMGGSYPWPTHGSFVSPMKGISAA